MTEIVLFLLAAGLLMIAAFVLGRRADREDATMEADRPTRPRDIVLGAGDAFDTGGQILLLAAGMASIALALWVAWGG